MDDTVISFNPHEFNVRVPSYTYPQIINFKMNGKLYPRQQNSIIGDPVEYYYNPEDTNFKEVENLLKNIFVTPASLQKFRDILGEIVYPQINSNHENIKINMINFVNLGNKTQSKKSKKLICQLINLIINDKKITHINDVIEKHTIIDKTFWAKLRYYYRRRRQGFQAVRPEKTYETIIDYRIKKTYILYENTQLTSTRFISTTDIEGLDYEKLFNSYVRHIQPKKIINEKNVQKYFRLPTILCFTNQQPMPRTYKLKNKTVFMTVECCAQKNCNKELNINIINLRDQLQNWIIQGIIQRIKRNETENIGFINAVLGKEEKYVEEPKFHFMTPR